MNTKKEGLQKSNVIDSERRGKPEGKMQEGEEEVLWEARIREGECGGEKTEVRRSGLGRRQGVVMVGGWDGKVERSGRYRSSENTPRYIHQGSRGSSAYMTCIVNHRLPGRAGDGRNWTRRERNTC